MKLSKVTLKNYRQFNSIHEFDFSKKSSKGINIVVAKNGFGKSSLYRAINWCLFGKEPRLKLSQVDSITQLNDHAEYLSKKGDKNEMFVEIQLQDELNDNKIVTIKRITNFLKKSDESNTKAASSMQTTTAIEVKYFKENKGQELITKEAEARIYIDSHILNENISNFFFFDGEKLSDFIKKNKSLSIQKHIDILTGISDIEQTRKHFENWKKNIEQSLPKTHKKGEVLRVLIDDLTNFNERKNSLVNLIETYKKRIDELPSKIEELKEAAGADNFSKKLNDDIDEIDDKIDILNLEIDDISLVLNKEIATKFSKLVLQKSLKNLYNLVKIEIDEDRLPSPEIQGKEALRAIMGKDNKLFIKDAENSDKKIIFGTINWDTGKDRSTFFKAIEEFNLFSKKQRDSSYKKLAQGGYDSANTLISANDLDAFNKTCIISYTEINNKKKVIATLHHDRSKILKKLDDIDEDKYRNASENREKLKQELNDLIVDKNADEKIVRSLSNQILRKNKKIKVEKKKLNLNSDDEKKIQFIDDCLDLLIPAIDTARKENLASLSTNFGSTFDKHCHKDYNASLDSNFNISVKNSRKKELALAGSKRLSEGETYLAGFSYMLAMKTMTDYNFPFIIDTPLASCDLQYRERIMRLFANLTTSLTDSHATFLFTPSEYTSNVKKTIENHISNHYELDIDVNQNAVVKKVI
jgi:DNA sulfur modification protein DndD